MVEDFLLGEFSGIWEPQTDRIEVLANKREFRAGMLVKLNLLGNHFLNFWLVLIHHKSMVFHFFIDCLNFGVCLLGLSNHLIHFRSELLQLRRHNILKPLEFITNNAWKLRFLLFELLKPLHEEFSVGLVTLLQLLIPLQSSVDFSSCLPCSRLGLISRIIFILKCLLSRGQLHIKCAVRLRLSTEVCFQDPLLKR